MKKGTLVDAGGEVAFDDVSEAVMLREGGAFASVVC